MKILLINTNQVVQKLLEMAAKKIEAQLIMSKEIQNSEEIGSDSDFVIIDDGVLEELDEDTLPPFLRSKKSIFLSSDDQNQWKSFFSIVLKKPFLPNDLLNILLQFKDNQTEEKHDQNIENQKDNKEETLDESFDQLLKDLDVMKTGANNDREILQENADEYFLQTQEREADGGVLDLQEIEIIKELLHENKKNLSHELQSGDLSVLSNLFQSKNSESLREILDGMQLTINISFPNKENK